MNEGTKFDKFVVVFYAFEKVRREEELEYRLKCLNFQLILPQMKTEKEIFHVPSAFERFGYQRKVNSVLLICHHSSIFSRVFKQQKSYLFEPKV